MASTKLTSTLERRLHFFNWSLPLRPHMLFLSCALLLGTLTEPSIASTGACNSISTVRMGQSVYNPSGRFYTHTFSLKADNQACDVGVHVNMRFSCLPDSPNSARDRTAYISKGTQKVPSNSSADTYSILSKSTDCNLDIVSLQMDGGLVTQFSPPASGTPSGSTDSQSLPIAGNVINPVNPTKPIDPKYKTMDDCFGTDGEMVLRFGGQECERVLNPIPNTSKYAGVYQKCNSLQQVASRYCASKISGYGDTAARLKEMDAILSDLKPMALAAIDEINAGKHQQPPTAEKKSGWNISQDLRSNECPGKDRIFIIRGNTGKSVVCGSRANFPAYCQGQGMRFELKDGDLGCVQ